MQHSTVYQMNGVTVLDNGKTGKSRRLPGDQINRGHERRNRLRFPVNSELRYQMVPRAAGQPTRGTGLVQNMSSKALAFRADTPLELGSLLNVSMNWPVKLDNRCLLRLLIEGRVLRSHNGLVVAAIQRYEFRTAGTGTGPTPQEITAMARVIPIRIGPERNYGVLVP